MGTRNHYWILDCIAALTAVVLGTTALCSFVGLVMSALPASALGVEALLCGVAIAGGLLFAGYLWGDHRDGGRRTSIRTLRAYQERHAMMLTRASNRAVEIAVAAPESREPATTGETPETMLVTSFTDVKAAHRAQRRQARRPAAVAMAA